MSVTPRGSSRLRPAVLALPGIVLHLIISVVAGTMVFFLRFAAAGCGESGRNCDTTLIGLGQNSLVYVVPAIWVVTALAAIISALVRRRAATRIIVTGISATLIFLLVAAGLTLLGAYAS